jgi:hypothetical protein
LDLIALPTYGVVAWWLIKHDGINGAAFAKLIVTVADCAILFMFAFKLKAFSLRDCVSGPLFRAIAVSGLLLALVFSVHTMHLKLLLSVPLVILCFVVYVLTFWVFAIDHEDRTTIYALRQRAAGILTRRHAAPVLQITPDNTAV